MHAKKTKENKIVLQLKKKYKAWRTYKQHKSNIYKK